MQKQDIETILASQRKFFATGKTLPVSWRLEQLKKLRTSMLRHEEDLHWLAANRCLRGFE